MSDPLSITGSAVGVISLGLVVCDQIVQYGRAYKGYMDDIQQMAARAEAVCAPLKVLRDIIQMTEKSQPDTAIDLSESVMRIDASVMRLRETIKRYGPTNHPDGSPDTARNQVRRVIYHFRNDTLRDMGQDLDNMQATLRTLISAYHWKETICARQETREMHLSIKSGMPPPSLSQAWYDAQTNKKYHMNSNKSLIPKKNSFAEQGRKEVKKGFTSYSRWLGLMITASLNISMDAGGISIYPTLSVQIPVSNPDRIYQLFKEIVRMKDHESAILRLQDEFSNQRLHPSCVVSPIFGSAYSLIGSLVDHAVLLEDYTAVTMRIIAFLLDSGVKVAQQDQPSQEYSCDSILWRYQWNLHDCQEEYMSIMERLLDSGLCIRAPKFNPNAWESRYDNYWGIGWKDNLRLILAIDDDAVQMPGIEKTILRRDSEGLRKALCEKQVLPEDFKSSNNPYPSYLLHLAEGWGDGIDILLDFGADASQYFAELHRPGEEYHHSTALLLRAGCFFSRNTIEQSYSRHDKGKRMHLFINELKSRREKLRTLAEAFLPSHMIPAGNCLLDGPDCIRVYEMLTSRTKDSTHTVAPKEFFFLNEDICSESVYHDITEVKCAEALYQAGFRDTCMIDLNGNSPLGTIAWDSMSSLRKMIEWHISKESKVYHQLPWADESVAHLLISNALLGLPCYTGRRNNSVSRIDEHTKEHVDELEERLNDFHTIRKALFQLPGVPDGCSCLCSHGGLTAASFMFRELIASDRFSDYCHGCLWRVVAQFIECDSSYRENPLKFIRALTFNALDLTHTCFNKTRKGCIRPRNERPDDEDYIYDTCDEPSAIEEFENLQAELELKFNELGLPLKEFVFKHWYRVVKDHLLTPPTPDEQYKCTAGARKIGVNLEQWEPSVPEWMTILFAPKVEEVDDEED